VRLRSLLLVAFSTALACGNESDVREWRASDHQEPTANPQQGEAGGPQTEEEAITALFNQSCAPCHGVDGHGGGPNAAALNVPDIASAELQESRTDEDIARVIRDGRGMMPAFSDDLNERGIEVLVGHVRSLREQP
jgi:mono/diheme cytochrome c family protein